MIVFKKTVNYNSMTKICKHKNCGKEFVSDKPGQKYCGEHRIKRNYYKTFIDETNQIIEHDNKSAKKITAICECCLKEFEITLIPKVKKYPKYCEEHRNEHKRLMYLKEKI